jgi:hypothetical protein
MTLREYIEMIRKSGYYEEFDGIYVEINGAHIPVHALSKDDIIWRFAASESKLEEASYGEPVIMHIEVRYAPVITEYSTYGLIGYNTPYYTNYDPETDEVDAVYFDN